MSTTHTPKIEAGTLFPALEARTLDGTTRDLGVPTGGHDWTMVVVYRGRHCPLCTRYLGELEQFRPRLAELGIDLVAVSGDSKEQLAEHTERLNVSFPLFYGLSIEQMKSLGAYISHPRSEKETDHPFAEPALFVVNGDRRVQVVDLSNNPFVRPQLDKLVSGLAWIRNPANDYPIRGTYAYA